MIFSKYEGAGNDFILIDDRSLTFNLSLVPQLCHRTLGIGADGVILLQPDSIADFRMRIFNSDGSEAESCGNGLRCLTRFAFDLGLFPQRIAMHDRIINVSLVGDLVSVCLGEPRKLSLNLPLYLNDGVYTIHFVDTGVPHAVLFVDDLASFNVSTIGPLIRHHRAFSPQGVNVNFAFLQEDGALSVRTFERGVEGETLACGTGAAAVAVIAATLYSLPSPISIHFPGGDMQVAFTDLYFSDLSLIGPARRVASESLLSVFPKG